MSGYSPFEDTQEYHDSIAGSSAPTQPTPTVTAATETPRTKGIMECLNKAFLHATGYEHRIALREAAQIGIEDLECELSATLRELADANAALVEAKRDSERLDKLEKMKSEHHAHFIEDGVWVNPSKSWKLEVHEANGTYDFPKKLRRLTLRAAIDSAMQKQD